MAHEQGADPMAGSPWLCWFVQRKKDDNPQDINSLRSRFRSEKT
jgi:hypothetical protein